MRGNPLAQKSLNAIPQRVRTIYLRFDQRPLSNPCSSPSSKSVTDTVPRPVLRPCICRRHPALHRRITHLSWSQAYHAFCVVSKSSVSDRGHASRVRVLCVRSRARAASPALLKAACDSDAQFDSQGKCAHQSFTRHVVVAGGDAHAPVSHPRFHQKSTIFVPRPF